jgi:glycosyltransferase involved in cell wall biosynthesis
MADITNNQPLVTVGICCYNRVEGFKNTLKYITGQTYKNLEIIISQDFNPTLDLTFIANAESDKRVTFYKQTQRLSMYNNFLFVLEKANGDYFMWASDDDWWAPDFIEKIMELLCNDPSAVAGHPDFIAVDENNSRLNGYPDFLPFIQEFTVTDDVKRIKNYINQFEAFGKPNLIYSIFKIDALRSKQVIDILKDCELWGDMLVVLTVLIKGKLVVSPQLLRTCTGDNEKTYTQDVYTPKVINLLVAYINIGVISHIYKKWNKFIYYHFKIINKSELSLVKKIVIYPTLIKKVTLFYYDLICCNVQLRGYNIFSKMRRHHTLN